MKDSQDNKGGRAFRSGYVAISGRPNVGKSTFLNAAMGMKLSIVTEKPQTTRNRIIGVKNVPGAQIVFFDTPGIHRPKHGLGSHMVKEARSAIKDVDLVLFMVEPRKPTKDDEKLVRTFRDIGKPVFLLVNKADTVKPGELLPVIKSYTDLLSFDEVFPISALRGEGVDEVLEHVARHLPEGEPFYPEDMFTENAERFLVAELIREKVMLLTHDEVPHSTAVEVAEWRERPGEKIFISANIYVEKDGQKGIIIGKRGERLRRIGSESRSDIEALLDSGVFLELFVKVKKDWRTKKSVLTELGFK
jgi:GTP-binding protein Era